jgi:hypothetical protein
VNREPTAALAVRGPTRRAAAAFVVLLLAAIVAGAAPPDPVERPATATDCHSLLHQFDVAWPAHRDAPRAPSARRSRDLGEADCAQSHFGDGVRHLRRALHDIGVKPVKTVSAQPAH